MMNNEDFERKMAFVVDQQARCVVAQERLYEAQHLTQQKIQEANDVVTRLAYVTNEGFKDHGAKINALINSQIELRESHRQIDESLGAKINALIDSQMELRESQKQTDEQLKQTDEKLRQLTATVDRYIRHRRNGG